MAEGAYEKSIKKLGTFDTAEQFWAHYSHQQRPSETANATWHLFRSGIVPVWEDAHNCSGGKWTVRLKKGLANRCWEQLLIATVADAFGCGDSVCGLVLSVKFNEDVLSVWNSDATDRKQRLRIRDMMKKSLGISSNSAYVYQPHSVS